MVVKAGEGVVEAAGKLRDSLKAAGVRVKLDDRADIPFGRRAVDAELQGIPIRIEVGPRDLANNHVTLVRRDTRAKEQVSVEGVAERLPELLVEVQRTMFERARQFREDNTVDARDYAEFKDAMATRRGFIRAYWCGAAECEQRIKEETRATIRVIPEDAEAAGPGACVYDGRPATQRALFAQSY
jgi:prolyl-tRNA synthetase